jgi:NAD(P)-dependent dehydrogenase (short-subunit alcohol dehydrogenase family)
MAMGHAADGIRVNAVCPGMMNTSMLANESEDNLKSYRRMNLLNRGAEPLEVAYTILHLASDESSFTTGAVVMVDAGSTTT